jgi:hypothetical protein
MQFVPCVEDLLLPHLVTRVQEKRCQDGGNFHCAGKNLFLKASLPLLPEWDYYGHIVYQSSSNREQDLRYNFFQMNCKLI